MTSLQKRVLVVEDQRLVAADLEDTLRRLGYEVVASVASGEEAIAKAIETRPELALMDIRLRGELDGIEAAMNIRARMDIPVIYLTAYADEETVRRAMLTGPFGYLVKPFNERELRAAIDVAIYKHASDRLLVQERSRRQAAEEFKFLVEGVEEYAIFLLDQSGNVTTWNMGAERINGYTAEEIIGRHFSVFYTPQEVEAGLPETELATAIEQGNLEHEGWQVKKDGSWFWASFTLSALRDEAHQVRGFARITRDMTARRQAELEQQQSVARMNAIIAGALDCIVSIDATGCIVQWNPAAEETFGYNRDEAIGREMAELIVPARLRAAHRVGFLRCLQTGEGPMLGRRIEMPALHKDGREIVVELSVMSVPVGASQMFTGFLRDVTARKEAEAEKNRQQEAQRLLDQTTVALTKSLELSETMQNAARLLVPNLADWCLVDLANGELKQVACAHIDPHKEELAQRLGRELVPNTEHDHGAYHVFKTGKSELHPALDDLEWTAELLGTAYPEILRELGVVSYMCVPIQCRGKTQGVLNLLRGTPGHRYTKYDLILAEELARRIGLAVDNARLFSEAQEAIAARDEFLQVASHELKTPLTPLQMQLDTLARAFVKAGIQNERLSAKLDAASRQTARLGRLVESLLDVSRISAGRIELEFDSCDLAQVVSDVVERYQAEAHRSGSQLTLTADEPIVGQWDRLRLEQIVSNLISNAIKYGAGRPIDVEVVGSDETVRVKVTDHGIGIEKEVLGRLFGRFERGVSLRHYGGLGLGLFIARQFAEAHGGTIVVQSQPNLGSTFTVVLPRMQGTMTSVMEGAEEAKR